ncbi:MAG: glycosyltransferase family 4 protein [Candidatus Brocadiaceae bacterium]|nr:glycosyltransferase family 4 protein [Candidatus Brocadiaceae bacterium]
MNTNPIIILHDLNGKPYYEAIEHFAKLNNIKINYYESSVVKLLIRYIIKRKLDFISIEKTLKNIVFRLKVPWIKDKIIIIGMAPYDFRIIWYKCLLKHNDLILSTSHPFWENDNRSPRKYSILTVITKFYWKTFLEDEKLKIVTVTKKAFNSLNNNFKVHGKISQIYHCVDTTVFKAQYHKTNNIIKILFVGRFLQSKGLNTIVELIDKMDPNKFFFTLVGDGEYKKNIEHVFAKKNVTYLGFKRDRMELSKIYKDHHFFLNLSIRYDRWEELFGIVNIEAMASGLIVIASNHIGPSEIIQNGINGFLVKENDSDTVSGIIIGLTNNWDKYTQISNNAALSAQQFNKISIAQQWSGLIQ